jgi:hypothetical protein
MYGVIQSAAHWVHGFDRHGRIVTGQEPIRPAVNSLMVRHAIAAERFFAAVDASAHTVVQHDVSRYHGTHDSVSVGAGGIAVTAPVFHRRYGREWE